MIERRAIPEHPSAAGGRLGRHVHHDPQSKAHPVRQLTAGPVVHRLWYRYLPVLDQGDVGACTGYAAAGMVGSKPIWPQVPRTSRPSCDGLRIYELNTVLDDFAGTYPPDDTGSSGLAAMKSCQQLGLITSYRWAFGLDDVVRTLATVGPVCLGTNWYEGFDRPNASGLVHIAGDVRGGHEYEAIGVDPTRRTIRCVNSWGRGWGDNGRFSIGWDDLERLLAEQGDAVVGLR